MPESGGDLAEFALGDEVKIEDDQGKVSVAEEEVGALEGLLGFGAAKPDEVTTLFVSVRGGIEGVATINEDEGEVALFREEIGNDEGSSRGLMRSDDFTEVPGGEFEGSLDALRFFDWNRRAMSSRELFAKLTAELVDLLDAQNMFIRTVFEIESSR